MAKHQMRHWVSLAGKALGALVIAGPAIEAGAKAVSNSDFQSFPGDVLYNYTGVSIKDGNINAKQTVIGVASVVGGLVLMKVFSYIARRF